MWSSSWRTVILALTFTSGRYRPHRRVEVDGPVVRQGQHEGRREGLAHARDGEGRGRGHGRLGGDVRQAAHADPRAAVGEEDRDRIPGTAVSLAELVETLLQGTASRRRRRLTGAIRRPDPDRGDDRARRQGWRRDRIRGRGTRRRTAARELGASRRFDQRCRPRGRDRVGDPGCGQQRAERDRDEARRHHRGEDQEGAPDPRPTRPNSSHAQCTVPRVRRGYHPPDA